MRMRTLDIMRRPPMGEGNLAPMRAGRFSSWWFIKLAVLVLSGAILLPLFKMCWPSIREEFVLLFQCHLNDTHLAQENSRLTMRIEKLRNEIEAVREEKKQCLNDNDMEHSAANRSFWAGVTACIYAEVAVIVPLVFCCCRLMNWFRAPQVRQRDRNWSARALL